MAVPFALARARFPAPVLDVLRTLRGAGQRSWLVGGAVRDLLLHRPRDAADFDVATPATPEQVAALFPRVIPTGIAHGTVTVLSRGTHVEVTTFRGEGAYLDGRRPEKVTFHTDLEADLARRDFTINALAYDPLAREFRDPFGGRRDLRDEIVRAVGDPAERFGEDGLRPLRAVRFAAQLGYALHPKTLAAIPGALPVVRKVSIERVADELTRLAVAPHAAAGVELMLRTGLLKVVLPDLARLPPAAVRHAGRVAQALPSETALRLAALLHALPARRVEEILVDLRMARRICDDASALVVAHACLLPPVRPARAKRAPAPPGAAWPGSDAEVRRWLSAVTPARAPALLDLREAEARSLPAAGAPTALARVRRLRSHVARVAARRPPLATGDLALDGRSLMGLLGIAPGPEVGEALRHLLDRVLEDPRLNDRPRLAELARLWHARRL
jgi:tRNA nucleotidyltransferase (CCA-adding enzyme)